MAYVSVCVLFKYHACQNANCIRWSQIYWMQSDLFKKGKIWKIVRNLLGALLLKYSVPLVVTNLTACWRVKADCYWAATV